MSRRTTKILQNSDTKNNMPYYSQWMQKKKTLHLMLWNWLMSMFVNTWIRSPTSSFIEMIFHRFQVPNEHRREAQIQRIPSSGWLKALERFTSLFLDCYMLSVSFFFLLCCYFSQQRTIGQEDVTYKVVSLAVLQFNSFQNASKV